MVDLKKLTVSELLCRFTNITEELRERGILRTENNPTGDLAEHLFCTAFKWTIAPNSAKGYDATDRVGKHFQIKGRRLSQDKTSRQLSAIRNLDQKPFDTLAGVLFDKNYSVLRAALIPHKVIEQHSYFSRHTNSHIFLLKDKVWDIPSVVDVTDLLRATVY